MQCPKCNSTNIQAIAKTKGKVKKRGLIGSLMWIFLACCTCGLILLIPLLTGGSKGKIKTKTAFVCMDCGKEFN
jgi:hypothetical protein|nr:MAG TPA: nucleic-acid-binding protein [Caudoviricetes sp.]